MPRALIMSSSSARSLAISGQPLNRLSDRRPTVRSGRSTRQLHPCGDSQQMVIQVDAEQSPVGATYPARARATHKSSSDQVLGQAPAIRALALPETYEVPVGVQRTCVLQPSPAPHASPPAPSAPTAAYAAGRCRPVALLPPAVHEGALQSVTRWPGGARAGEAVRRAAEVDRLARETQSGSPRGAVRGMVPVRDAGLRAHATRVDLDGSGSSVRSRARWSP